MSRRLVLVALFALASCIHVGAWAAPKVLFYQPQRADLAVPDADWPKFFQRIRAMGFDTLAVQWVAYGDAFTGARERSWLANRLREARASGLKLVLGLGADPQFFTRQKAPPEQLGTYFRELAETDRSLARTWLRELGSDAVLAWYLPIEVDDLRWREGDARAVLLEHLRTEVRALQALHRAPVYVSTFFAGHMAPEAYARLLRELDATGVRVWVQDGAGTGRLTHHERALYMAPLQRCKARLAHGVVYELFEQTSGDERFAARPLAADSIREALAQQAPCDGDSVYFEMRYLPGMQRIREADRKAAGFAPEMHNGWADSP
ncbi:DUF4434 domain-containing protein [Oleiagrimonas sp. MCCC 1A03011]|uniref:DUF4434 domain-containing protein n=1 Tax=Oleiagrimonas sp. MCCC 1A03011 TaxID=1926883 RepID=UPI000DC3C4AB|nr:DUF4434 domain-containing protein [Oleiagrimonas sp. MCCC 1A03011]RAP57504.1 hypothetical protein BTJ49_10615 [Oleiagrimonas sp. MCCC 1A03011]